MWKAVYNYFIYINVIVGSNILVERWLQDAKGISPPGNIITLVIPLQIYLLILRLTAQQNNPANLNLKKNKIKQT